MVIDFLLSDLGAAVIAGAISLFAYLGRRFVLSRIAWQRGQEALRRLGQHAQRAVMATHAEYVSAIRAGRADGVLTEAEAHEAKALARAKLLEYCGWDDLRYILGIEGALSAVNDELESTLHVMKGAGLLPQSARASMPSSADASQVEDSSTSASA